jgi:hypothetical protein
LRSDEPNLNREFSMQRFLRATVLLVAVAWLGAAHAGEEGATGTRAWRFGPTAVTQERGRDVVKSRYTRAKPGGKIFEHVRGADGAGGDTITRRTTRKTRDGKGREHVAITDGTVTPPGGGTASITHAEVTSHGFVSELEQPDGAHFVTKEWTLGTKGKVQKRLSKTTIEANGKKDSFFTRIDRAPGDGYHPPRFHRK